MIKSYDRELHIISLNFNRCRVGLVPVPHVCGGLSLMTLLDCLLVLVLFVVLAIETTLLDTLL